LQAYFFFHCLIINLYFLSRFLDKERNKRKTKRKRPVTRENSPTIVPCAAGLLLYVFMRLR
jgi:hypothetical protein